MVIIFAGKIMIDNKPIKIYRNSNFTTYYYNTPDTTGTGEMTFVGRKHYKWDWEIAKKLNYKIVKRKLE
jgi:hypothetical protein